MIQTLKIKNFAIIKEALLNFEDGLNILTGETGAGKSMIVDAISILLGAKAKTQDIRTGEDEASLEGIFSFQHNRKLEKLFEESGINVDAGEIVVARKILRNGKNKIFINGSLTSQNVLYEVGKHMIDICAQNENRILMNPAFHIDILDDYASLDSECERFAELYKCLSGLIVKREELARKVKEVREKSDYLQFLVDEVKGLDLKEGEEEELKNLRKKLANTERIRSLAEKSYDLLYSNEGAVFEGLKVASKDFDDLKEYDRTFKKTAEGLLEMSERVADISFDLKKYADELDFDQASLDEVEARLDKIAKVSRKYGSVSEAIERAKKAQEDLACIENYDFEARALEGDIEAVKSEIRRVAQALSSMRKKKARLLDEEITRELKSLGMDGARFCTKALKIDPLSKKKEHVLIDDFLISPKGKDNVEFHITTNAGEDPKPLIWVASLGELSRIMLALKVVFYSKNKLMSSFIFDEVDTGIGGKVAEIVGEKLKVLSAGKQVICVTHLSQIAAKADHHYVISKKVVTGRTIFEPRQVVGEEKTDEIARMIGGVKVTPKTKDLARELLGKSKEINA